MSTKTDEAPVAKRSRFVIRNISPNIQSQLSEQIFSADILPKILKFLTSLKEKIRMERVSQIFNQSSKSVEAWSAIKRIVIKDTNEGSFKINGEIILAQTICDAIESIFIRNRNVQLINLRDCRASIVYNSIVSTIMIKEHYHSEILKH